MVKIGEICNFCKFQKQMCNGLQVIGGLAKNVERYPLMIFGEEVVFMDVGLFLHFQLHHPCCP